MRTELLGAGTKSAENKSIDKPMPLVLAGTIFDPEAAKRAINLINRVVASHNLTDDIHLCYSNGSKLVHPGFNDTVDNSVETHVFTTLV